MKYKISLMSIVVILLSMAVPAAAQRGDTCVRFTVEREFDSVRDQATYYRVRATNSCRSDIIVRIGTHGPRGEAGRDFYLRAGGRQSMAMLSRSGRFWIAQTRNWRR